MIALIAFVLYLLSLIRATRALLNDRSRLKWTLLVVLNVLFWLLAYLNVQGGLKADANGTSGDSWGMPLFTLVAIVTLVYHFILYTRHKPKVHHHR